MLTVRLFRCSSIKFNETISGDANTSLTLVRARTIQVLLHTLSGLLHHPDAALEVAVCNSLRAIATSCSAIVGSMDWGLPLNHSVTHREEARKAVELLLQVSQISNGIYNHLPYCTKDGRPECLSSTPGRNRVYCSRSSVPDISGSLLLGQPRTSKGNHAVVSPTRLTVSPKHRPLLKAALGRRIWKLGGYDSRGTIAYSER